MFQQRHVEIFSAGCPVCQDALTLVSRLVGSPHQIDLHDLRQLEVASRAASLGIRSVPATLIDGQLVSCCANCGPDEAALRAAGLA